MAALLSACGTATDTAPTASPARDAAVAIPAASNCPAATLAEFVPLFFDDADIQRIYAVFPLENTYLDTDAEPEPLPVTQKLPEDEAEFPLVPDLSEQATQGLQWAIIEEEGNDATVKLWQEDTGYLILLRFHRDGCWKLARVDDQST
ncbi:MAG: hypothetical protein LBL59_04060 [Xanthomonadaceae bacterium]|nr:hypothetical protein [Xanthomonadaceae bacterium]